MQPPPPPPRSAPQQPQNSYPPQQPGPAPTGPHYSIDVECVATGTDHNSRDVGQISLIDANENVLLNLYVKPAKPVVSYLTALTGLTAELIEQRGTSLDEAKATLKAHLPRNAVLVGLNIRQDVQWLSLREGEDFRSMVDIAGLYRVFNTRHNNWTAFGQEHLVKVLLGYDGAGEAHDAVSDAIKSMRLFHTYHYLCSSGQLQAAQAALLAAPIGPSFARRNPSYEGVCMGNRKLCTCGAPFFY